MSGRFTQKQKDIYNIVLAAHDHVARIVKPHMMYTEVHNAAYMTLAEGLVGLGLLKGPAADAVAAGAMTMLMPHGLGHGLGMDVHDCEAMGERSFGIRIEDDILVTESGSRIIGDRKIPVTVEELEGLKSLF